MVAARSAAMAFNRLVDARFDALNPRTAQREIPRGAMSVREARDLPCRDERWPSSSCARRSAGCASLLAPVALAHRLLVLPGQARHVGDAVLPGPRDGRRPGRRLDRLGGGRILAAGAARPGHRHVGRRLRRAVRLPGPRLRSGAWPAIDSGTFRRAASPSPSPAPAARRHVASLAALGVVAGLGAVYQGGVALVAALLVFEQSLVSATDLSQVKTGLRHERVGRPAVPGHDGIEHLCQLRPRGASCSPSPGPVAPLYAMRTLSALLQHGQHVDLVDHRVTAAAC